MGRLQNKIALVTGGTTGIGFATVKRFIEEGATVYATGSRQETVDKAQAEIPRAKFLVSDAGDPPAIRALIETIIGAEKRIDVMFLNAGIAVFAPWEQTTEEVFDRTFNVNLKGPFFAIQAALPHLPKGGSVILNTSVLGTKGLASSSVYSASKAALRLFARVAAAEFAERGIRINAVAPGPIETPIYDKLGFPQADLDQMAQGLAAQIPLARFGQPVEIAEAAVFLASDEASFINGVELPIDGGFAQV